MFNTTVIKRDGSREPFAEAKIIRVVRAAGLTDKQSRLVANNISSWVKANDFTEISSSKIKNQVIIELTEIDSYSAGLYRWYENTKAQSVFSE